MKYILKNEELTFFVASKAKVSPVDIWEDGKNVGQAKDAFTDKPLWKVPVQLISGEDVEDVIIKIASDEAPVLTARTDYKAKGDLYLSPYVNQNNNRSAVSFLLIGELVKTNPPAQAGVSLPALAKQ